MGLAGLLGWAIHPDSIIECCSADDCTRAARSSAHDDTCVSQHRCRPPPFSATAADSERKIWGVIAASSAGTVIEWYDFYIFGSLAAVSRGVFYPESERHDLAAQVAGDVRRRLRRAAVRRARLRAHRRPGRPQVRVHGDAAHHGRLDGGDRPAARLRARSASARRSCSSRCASSRVSRSAASTAARRSTSPSTRPTTSAASTRRSSRRRRRSACSSR